VRADDRARVSVLVRVPPDVAFRAFTEDVDRWWRRGQRFRVAATHGSVVHIEGGVGGRLFESFATSSGDGAPKVLACGVVTAWEPPRRFAFDWRSPNYAAGEKTFVEVLFEESASGTLVTVTHSGWSALPDDHPVRHGENAAVFLRRTGMWWVDQMTSLRLHLESAS
jgi:uncharacterized protein YndB with AHSA1/START domain